MAPVLVRCTRLILYLVVSWSLFLRPHHSSGTVDEDTFVFFTRNKIEGMYKMGQKSFVREGKLTLKQQAYDRRVAKTDELMALKPTAKMECCRFKCLQNAAPGYLDKLRGDYHR